MNKDSKFMMANDAIMKLWGINSIEEFIGKTDHDYFEKSLADLYVNEDLKVLAGEAIVNRRWMVPDNDGQMNWYLSTKLPLKDKEGRVIGLCGLLRNLKRTGKEYKPYYDLSEVIDYIDEHFRQNIKMQTLADLLGVSVSQLDRKFKDFTGVSPTKYIQKVRLAAVASALLNTDKTVSQLAFDNGFYDHSQLSRMFKLSYGVSPIKYRNKSNL
ncbi:MAG: AraC family transcriptional regulator [Lentisphaerales bacterium]|nr:AraC family transcriptional regulator [Lentisphaerales bacterium]